MKKEVKIKAVIFDIGGALQIPKTIVRLIQDTHLAGVPTHRGHRNRSIHEYLASKLGMNVILFKNNEQLFKEKQWKQLFKQPA